MRHYKILSVFFVFSFCILHSAFLFGQAYYPSVSTKGAVSDGDLVIFDGVSGKYIKSSGVTNAGSYISNLSLSLGNLQTNVNVASNALNNAIGTVQTNLNAASNALNNAIGAGTTNLTAFSNQVVSGYATGTPVYTESDPVWTAAKSGYATGTPVYGESDPVWDAAKSGYATGTPVYGESDPVWTAAKGGYATGTPLYAYSETDPVWDAAKSGYATGTPVYGESDPVWDAAKSGYATGTPLYAYSETDPVWDAAKSGYATGTPVYAESDPVWDAAKSGYATGTPLYAYSETDPVWVAARAGYATGTPVYAESDPVWEAAKSGYATGTPVYVEEDPVWEAAKSSYATGTPVYVESDPVWDAAKSGYATGTPVYVEIVANGLNTRSNTWDVGAARAAGLDSRSNTWDGGLVTATGAYDIATGLNTRSNTWEETVGTVVDKSNAWDAGAAQAAGLDSRSNTWDGGMVTVTGAYDIATGLNTRSNTWDAGAAQAAGLDSRSNTWEETLATVKDRSNAWDSAVAGGVVSLNFTGAVNGAITFSGPSVTQTNNNFNFSGGGGEISYGTNDSSAYRGDWGEAVSNLASVTSTNTLKLKGGIMEGPETNTAGYYGNGAGLTNLTRGLPIYTYSSEPTQYVTANEAWFADYSATQQVFIITNVGIGQTFFISGLHEMGWKIYPDATNGVAVENVFSTNYISVTGAYPSAIFVHATNVYYALNHFGTYKAASSGGGPTGTNTLFISGAGSTYANGTYIWQVGFTNPPYYGTVGVTDGYISYIDGHYMIIWCNSGTWVLDESLVLGLYSSEDLATFSVTAGEEPAPTGAFDSE